MSAQYVRPLYQLGELIDSYEFSLAALYSERSIYDSIAHKRDATRTWDGPRIFTYYQGKYHYTWEVSSKIWSNSQSKLK